MKMSINKGLLLVVLSVLHAAYGLEEYKQERDIQVHNLSDSSIYAAVYCQNPITGTAKRHVAKKLKNRGLAVIPSKKAAILRRPKRSSTCRRKLALSNNLGDLKDERSRKGFAKLSTRGIGVTELTKKGVARAYFNFYVFKEGAQLKVYIDSEVVNEARHGLKAVVSCGILHSSNPTTPRLRRVLLPFIPAVNCRVFRRRRIK